MKKLTFYLAVIALFYACNKDKSKNSTTNLQFSHYDIQLKIDPASQFISVNGNLKLLIEKDSLDTIQFKLNKQFKISSFSVNGDTSYLLDSTTILERWLPNALRILYKGSKTFHNGDIIDVQFSYEGRITNWSPWSGNVIGTEWVEIGLYFPWYPSINNPFTYRVTIDIPPAYNVFSMGKYTEMDNKKIFENNYPVEDFIICASKDLTITESTLLNHSFRIVNSTLADTTIDSIQQDITHYYQLYNKWFGEPEVQDICLVISKREGGGGYARKGALFLGGINDTVYFNNKDAYNRYFGHEIAHFWWHGSEGDWEDWLSESFAEYSAMMLIRELIDEKEFDSSLSKKISKIINTPPVWGLDKSSPDLQVILYSKGVILLSELEEKIGYERFLKLCRARLNGNIKNSQEFLNLLEEREGIEIKEWFEQSLKTK
jgi:aminopeptidase N